MTKFKFQEFGLLCHLSFGFNLTFACLREAASAKAGILTFGLG
jgi:hypothetical protein